MTKNVLKPGFLIPYNENLEQNILIGIVEKQKNKDVRDHTPPPSLFSLFEVK